ncbi:hypothetical protein VDT1_3704 [Vibrio sp. 16]|nr:hypothetical protein VDT1_3704 [Vibrio sp. 16]
MVKFSGLCEKSRKNNENIDRLGIEMYRLPVLQRIE